MVASCAAERYRRIRESLPSEVSLVIAAKGRTPQELAEVIEAGATAIGENYVQEADRHVAALGQVAGSVQWHMIGHLQRNKVGRALSVFDLIQSVDSVRLGRAISRRAVSPVSILVEVNIGGEGTKHGVAPGRLLEVMEGLGELENVHIEGLMTMEPYCPDPEDARPYFRKMRAIFERLNATDLRGGRMKVLSMGMTNSYRVAVEEGSNMVRLGTAVFGPRPP